MNIYSTVVAIEQNPKIEGVLIILNTVGGDVEAGLAISEMIATLIKTNCLDCFRRRSFHWCANCCIL